MLLSLLILILVPAMLLYPLVFVAFVPRRTGADGRSSRTPIRQTLLACSTLVLLAAWIALVAGSSVAPSWVGAAAAWWCLWFVPLWRFGALPAIAERNPLWGHALQGSAAATGPVRSASLVVRSRRSPIRRSMWSVAVLVSLVGLGAIAARGRLAFPVIEPPAELRAEPAASLAVPVSPERSKWRTALVAYASIVGLCLAILPPLVRRNLTAPEPMDADGSAEVADRYERHRRLRVLGLFWAYGVLLPAMLGAGFTVKVWFPGLESLATVLVGCGGVLIGVGFGILGSLLMVERARIVETLVRIGRTDAAMST